MVVDERQVAEVITMLAINYNNPKGQGDDGDLSSALTNSLFAPTEGQVRLECLVGLYSCSRVICAHELVWCGMLQDVAWSWVLS